MSMRDASKRGLLILMALIGGAGCDFIVEAGQTLNLVNRMQVFGSGGNAQNAPLPSVRVQPGGTVVVQDADLFGGGTIVSQVDQARYGMAGAGIQAFGGTVRVQQGLVRGGPIVLNVGVPTFDEPAPGILALSSVVEITGGTVSGGAVQASFPGGTVPVDEDFLAARALDAIGSVITIRGGVFTAGAITPPDPQDDPSLHPTMVAAGSNVEIRGGEFNGGVAFADSTVRIFGGHAFVVALIRTGGNACGEIHGGNVSVLGLQGGRVFVFGTGLALQPFDEEASILTGTLEDGTSLFLPVVNEGTQLNLVAPGTPGCP